eukprot:PhM_4_TR17448/c1_g2_i1/m.88774
MSLARHFALCVALIVLSDVASLATANYVFGQSASYTGKWHPGQRFTKGIMVAFSMVNANGGVYGRTLQLRPVDDGNNPARTVLNTRALMAMPDVIGLIGYTGSECVKAALPVAKAGGMPLIAPMTGDTTLRVPFEPYIVNLRVSHSDEAIGMVRTLSTGMALRRLCLIFDVSMFQHELDVMMASLPEKDIDTSCVYTYDSTLKNSSSFTQQEYGTIAKQFLATSPQAFLFFTDSTWMTNFADVCYALVPTLATKFTAGSWVEYDALNHFKAKGYPFTALIQTRAVPHPLSTSNYLSQMFRAVMTQVEGASVSYDYYAFEGFLVGRWLYEMVKRNPSMTRQGLWNAIYHTHIAFVVGVPVGPMTDNCDTTARYPNKPRNGAMCNCTQGSHVIGLTMSDETYQVKELGAFIYELMECQANIDMAPVPQLVGLPPVEPSFATAALNAGLSTEEYSSVPMMFRITSPSKAVTLPVKRSNFIDADAISTTVGNTFLLATLGLAPTDHQSNVPVYLGLSKGMVHKDQLENQPFERERIFIFPTLQQELYSLVSVLKSATTMMSVTLLLRDRGLPTGVDYRSAVYESLRTFGLEQMPLSVATFSGATELTQRIPTDATAYALVIGMNSTVELRAVAERLSSGSAATVGLMFSETVAAWSGLANCTTCVAGLPRIRLTSNLPLWTEAAASASTFVEFYLSQVATFDDAVKRHPLTYIGFYIARLFGQLKSRMRVFRGAGIIDTIYIYGAFSSMDVVVGPYSEDDKCNIGVRSTHHYSLASILFDAPDAHGDLVTKFSQCGTNYKPYPEPTSTLNVGAILGGCIGFVVVFGIVVGVRRHFVAKAHNAHAPREAPVCFLATDIQSSTKLWEAFPAQMPEAVETHHSIIRRLMKEYDAYEVKTIGDAFMIAVKSTLDGALLAMDIQQELFDATWPEGLDVDAVCGGDTNPEVWNGLRVRVGLHHATDVTPKYDSVRGRFDYYGSDVLLLKKVESSGDGGQITITHASFEALRQFPEFDTLIDGFVSRRCVLRDAKVEGVAEPLTIYSLYPLSLAARTFATEQELDVLPTVRVTQLHGGGDTDVQSTVASSREDIYLHVLFSTCNKKDLKTLLSLYCSAMGLPERGIPIGRLTRLVSNAILVLQRGSAANGSRRQSVASRRSSSHTTTPTNSKLNRPQCKTPESDRALVYEL